MKVWTGYGTEHSYRLVMIGRFKEAKEAEEVKQIIDRLTTQVMDEEDLPSFDATPRSRRYSRPMLELMTELNLISIGSTELEQLRYDVNYEVKETSIIFKTDEIDVAAFVKILVEKGARVEMYSAHDYPDEEKDSPETE